MATGLLDYQEYSSAIIGARTSPEVQKQTQKMPEAGVQQDAEQHIGTAGNADIVLGILTYNNAETIGSLTRNAQEVLKSWLPNGRTVLVNADGGSKDGTPERALASVRDKNDFVQITYPIYPAQKISPEYYGVPGKANAVQAVFGVANELNATACVIVDSQTSLTPDWMDALVRPVMEEGVDFVVPCYQRHKYEGAIISSIVYPLIRALYGKRIHQPIGGDYAVSGKLVKHVTRQPPPDGDTTNSGIDIWMAVQAACGGFVFAEASLGPRVHSQNEPAPEVSTMLAQVLGSVFTEMNRTAPCWQRLRGSQPLRLVGPHFEPVAEPAPVDPNPMIQSFRLGYQNLQDIYRLVLPPATLMDLKRLLFSAPDAFRFDDMLWARLIYDFALAWRARIIDRDHLLRALTPLYLGWVGSYVRSVRDAGAQEAQDRIETLCLAYEAQKGYLISRWRWPDTFNP